MTKRKMLRTYTVSTSTKLLVMMRDQYSSKLTSLRSTSNSSICHMDTI
jgi:hypothetical protein